MDYSVDKLASQSECDSVIAVISKEKSDLQYKQNLLEHRQQLVNASSTDIAAEMVVLNAKIASYEGLAQSLPEGEAKQQNNIDLEAAKHRVFQLQSKMAEQGSLALLGIQVDLGQLAAQAIELEAALASVNARKAVL